MLCDIDVDGKQIPLTLLDTSLYADDMVLKYYLRDARVSSGLDCLHVYM